MAEKIGRNDPCPCGSGKKYKNCCQTKALPTKRKFAAKWLKPNDPKESKEEPQGVNLMDRVFGEAIEAAKKEEKPPVAPSQFFEQNENKDVSND